MNSKGFTLVEIVVALAILGILGTVTAVSVTSILAKEKTVRIQSDLTLLEAAANHYLLWQSEAAAEGEIIGQGVLVERGFLSQEVTAPVEGFAYQITVYDKRPSARVVMTDGTTIYRQGQFTADTQSDDFR